MSKSVERKKTAFDAPRSNLFNFPPEELTIVDDPKHYLYDPRIETPPDEEMLDSIRKHGVIQPVVIVREDDKVLVVAGRRRVRAVLMVNKRLKKDEEPIRVPCVPRKGSEADLYEAAVAENTQRRQDTILETVAKANRLMTYTNDIKRVAAALHVSDMQVRRLLKVNDLAPELKKALGTGQIGLDAALQFQHLPKAEQSSALRKVLKEVGEVPPSPSPTPPVAAGPDPTPPPPRGTSKSKASKRPAVTGKAVKKSLGKPMPMRGRREVEERLEIKHLHPEYRRALLWVMHRDDADASAPSATAPTAPERKATQSPAAASPPQEQPSRDEKSPFGSRAARA